MLLLDEPTVGLDPVLRASLWQTFSELAAAGTTLLVSSHVMDEATHCEQLLLLREGRIAFAGAPTELLSADRDRGPRGRLPAPDPLPGGGAHVTATATLATAARVVLQLRRDPRTIALVIAVPVALVALMKGVLEGSAGSFDRVGAPLVGIFPLISMFLVTSITMLRERVSGTLERLMTMPLAKLDLLAGYGLAFAGVAVVQGVIVAGFAIVVLGLDVAGSAGRRSGPGRAQRRPRDGAGVARQSAFARTEFQAVQFMPALILPQLLLCGLFVPRDQMAPVLEAVSWALPMTYAYDAISRVATDGELGAGGWLDVLVVAAVTVLCLALGALTLRRRTE